MTNILLPRIGSVVQYEERVWKVRDYFVDYDQDVDYVELGLCEKIDDAWHEVEESEPRLVPIDDFHSEFVPLDNFSKVRRTIAYFPGLRRREF